VAEPHIQKETYEIGGGNGIFPPDIDGNDTRL